MADPVRQDTTAPFWTLAQGAQHFGYERATIRKYIREGLPTYFAGTMVKPAELITEVQERQARERATRAQ